MKIIENQIRSETSLCLLLPSLSPGGMQRVMSELAVYFCAQGNIEVHLVLFGKDPQQFYAVPRNLIIHKPKTKFVDKLRFLYSFGRLIYVRRTVKSIRPESVLTFGEYWNNLVLLSLIGLAIPVYVSDRSRPGKNLGFVHNLLRKILYRRAAGFVAQTNYSASLAAREGWNKNIRVIGNPIRPINPDGKTEKENFVLSVGRLVKTKHFDDLIRAFVETAVPGWKLIIVGGDAQKQFVSKELRNIINKLNAEKNVILEGYQADTDYYYRKSRIFAFMSSSEGFPNVIGEALSAGLPVVSYDCLAGPSDMITDGLNGFLVPLYDYDQFKEKLTLLMENEEMITTMSSAALTSVQGFEPGNVGKQFQEFILPNIS